MSVTLGNNGIRHGGVTKEINPIQVNEFEYTLVALQTDFVFAVFLSFLIL